MKRVYLCILFVIGFTFSAVAKEFTNNDLPKRSVMVSQSTVTAYDLFIYLIDLDTSEIVIVEYFKGDIYRIIHTGINVDQKEQSKVIVENTKN